MPGTPVLSRTVEPFQLKQQKKHQSKRFDLKAKKKLHHTGPYYIFTLKIIPNLQKKTDHQPEPPTRTPTRALRC
jgi:uncharacterized membrane protein